METNGAVTPPVEYPRFFLRGKEYHLKFGLGAMYRLEQMGLNPGNLKEEILAYQKEGKNIKLVLVLAAASLGTLEGETFTGLGLTPEQIADAVSDSNRFAELAAAVTSALVKVQPAATTTAPAPPAKAPFEPERPN